MKISKQYLQKVIKEELSNILENDDDFITNNISIDTLSTLTGITFGPEEYPHERVRINKTGNVYTVSTTSVNDKGVGFLVKKDSSDERKNKLKRAILDASNRAKKQVERERRALSNYDRDMD